MKDVLKEIEKLKQVVSRLQDDVNQLKGKTKTTENFKKPTVEEVRAYCMERKNGIDAESFVSFYESKGWKIGKTPMKSWKSAIVTWEKKKKQQEPKQQFATHNYTSEDLNMFDSLDDADI